MSSFPVNLRYLRKRAHMTQPELAQKIGVTRSTVSMYELGRREPNFEMLETIADLFNVDMNFLTGNDSEKKSPLPISGNELSEAKRRAIERILTLDDDEVDYLNRLADAALDR